jgi:ribonuclease BN (tRNA processing enzyme)
VLLTVIGCAAAWGRGPDAASSCYLVEDGDTAIVLDLGQGAFARLATERAPESLAAVLVSHAHADHCVDLIPFRHYLRYEAQAAPGRVELRAPEVLPGRFDALTGEDDFLGDLRFTALTPGAFRVGTLSVTVGRVTHAADSYAFRVSTDAAAGGLVYSGDCGRTADLVSLLRPGDTLLCEASFGAGPVPDGVPHLDAHAAADAARSGGASRLVLTHIQSGWDPGLALEGAQRAFAGATLLARPGLVLEL